jgi:hypothetical protein
MTLTLEAIAETFDARAVRHEPAVLTGWPPAEVLDGLRKGELWVAKDLTAEACPRSTWIVGHPLYANDWTAVDAQGRARAFRRLDPEWYTWLHHAVHRARQRLEHTQPEAWRELAARFNALWSVACRWWGNAEVGELHRDFLDARYTPPEVCILPRGTVQRAPGSSTPAAGQPAGYNSWPYPLRMEHAAACARALRDEHGITTDQRGNYVGPADLTHEELIRIAIAVSRHVANAMRGKAAA